MPPGPACSLRMHVTVICGHRMCETHPEASANKVDGPAGEELAGMRNVCCACRSRGAFELQCACCGGCGRLPLILTATVVWPASAAGSCASSSSRLPTSKQPFAVARFCCPCRPWRNRLVVMTWHAVCATTSQGKHRDAGWEAAAPSAPSGLAPPPRAASWAAAGAPGPPGMRHAAAPPASR
jgi:hypothetical protein